MKVIVAGFPKTGTKTINAALTRLGYKVYDTIENVTYLQKEWGKIFRDGWNIDDFRQMYKDVDAVVDLPACYFWEEIHQAFPDAKIILSMREDEETWFNSWKSQMENADNFAFRMMKYLSPSYRASYLEAALPVRYVVLGINTEESWNPFAKRKINRELMIKKYRAHNAHVLQNAPSDQLLVYQCSEGWEPLCRFLGNPVPDEPFPRKNVAGNILREFLQNNPNVQKWKREMKISKAVLAMTFITAAAYALYRRGPATICEDVAHCAAWLPKRIGIL